MTNLIILPVLVPFLAGILLIFIAKNKMLSRTISAATVLAILGISVYITAVVYTNGIQTLEMGGWRAPFGIVFVADLFASLMVVLSSIVAVACLFFGFKTLAGKRERGYYYPFYFFLLVGVNGSFLTGDIFNLFVFFEVMLIASFILIVHGGTKYQLRESFKYVLISVFSSILFLVAVAYLYSITGTLNMAHLAERVAEVDQQGVLNVIAVLFLIVFATKGALFPLYFWLPNSYFGPPAAVAALFGGLLTKVGIYAIIRTFTLIFTHNPDFTHNIILAVAGFTMFFGVLGAVSQFDFKRVLSYHIISQVGYMVMGLGIYTPLALAGAIYYIAHHIIVKSALFLFAGVTEKVTGTTNLHKMGGLLKTHPAAGWLFLVTAFSLAGLPPLSGFFSKFVLVVAGMEEGRYLIVAVSLLVGLLTLFSMIKIFIYAFWGKPTLTDSEVKRTPTAGMLTAIIPLVILTITLGLAAEPIFQFSLQAAEEILNPATYIEAVNLKE